MNEDRDILIVDDEPSARETLEALLISERYSLTFATNGRQALELLGQSSTDLVLCDVMMPGMDGFEVCRLIKNDASLRFVPVMLITALDGQDEMVRGLESGADEFLTKPVDKAILRARVRSLLRVRTHYNELRESPVSLDILVRKKREQLAAEAHLSSRECEVLDLLLLGRSYEDIGTALGITARTAKFHQVNLLNKLGAESRNDLLRLFLL